MRERGDILLYPILSAYLVGTFEVVEVDVCVCASLCGEGVGVGEEGVAALHGGDRHILLLDVAGQRVGSR